MDLRDFDFQRCERSVSSVWLGTLDELEISLPGDSCGPYPWCKDYIQRVWEILGNRKVQSKALLEEVCNLKGEWFLDAVSIDGECLGEASYSLYYSIESDIYGLWSVIYHSFQLHETGILKREQQ